ncbi:hypothetical protein IWX76_001493 [Pedobacter sp. CAN_A7]|uniref:DUF3078 domain-containing protein n=1 Tax=Pedobacter sp. CAN_A7 TaxID=2787722 RepID=UPI001A18C8EB
MAQEIDTIPINTTDLQIKLKRSPLPSRIGSLIYKPVELAPKVVDAEINYWNTKTSIGLNLNQAAFSDNWNGGGVNSMALTGLINYKTEYRKENLSYTSEVILNYGKVKNRGQLQKKTVDRIYIDNKAAIQLSKNWYFFGSINFESQFDLGYSYEINDDGAEVPNLLSRFMSPGYLTESIGFEYKPNQYFSTRIGTGTARQTFVLDTSIYNNPKNTNNFGVPIGSKMVNELAFQVVMNYDKDIFKNVNLKSKYMAFVPYDNFGYINHRLDVALTAKVNRFMNTSITGVGLYDRNSDSKIQGSQTLSLGLIFIFPR